MTDNDAAKQTDVPIKAGAAQPLIAVQHSALYLQTKSSWYQRWQKVIEQCSDGFIRF